MNLADAKALLPMIILAATAVLVMLAVAWRRRRNVAVALTLAGLAAAFLSLRIAADEAPHPAPPLFVVDSYALFYMGLILAASAAFTLLAWDYFAQREVDQEEIYILMLVATLGSLVLVASSHLVSLFLGLELLSIALYGMIAYPRTQPLPLEAGLKYLVLAAVSAAFLLFGIALIYTALGTMELARIASILTAGVGFDRDLVLSGLMLLATGLGFKLALVPFHLWTPDVYEGAPAPVSAFVATVSKGAVLGVVLRYFYATSALSTPSVFLVISAIALASMLAGNLLALLQRNVKRLLAYSSIAHLGYMLVALLAGGELGPTAVTFYLVAYFVTILGAFGVVSILSAGDPELVMIDDYRGLFWRRPVVAAVFTAMLLSLAGIPLTAGFVGKFYVIAAGASSAIWTLVIALVIASGIGLYYYLRVIVAMYGQYEEYGRPPRPTRPVSSFVLAGLTGLLLWFGVFPGAVIQLIRNAVGRAA
jgi:NADH-quinone oxidoreductase subunit N